MPSLSPSLGEQVYSIDRRCLHGAPPAGAAPQAALAVSQLVAKLAEARDALAQVSLLAAFAAAPETRAIASSPAAARILVSAAVDAFGDGQDICTTFLRAAAFLEGVGVGGSAFLAAISESAPAGTRNVGLEHFYSVLAQISAGRAGIARELRGRLSCGCLEVVERRASPAAVAAAGATEARATAAIVNSFPGGVTSADTEKIVAPLIKAAVARHNARDPEAAAADAALAGASYARSTCDACGSTNGVLKCSRCHAGW
jgi:hypothetical protein